MGARPIALLNSLRFGSLDSARVRYLFAGCVKGIGDYGNCVGIPTVAGEVNFDPSYAFGYGLRPFNWETSVSLHLLTNDTGCVWRHAFDEHTGEETPFRSGYVNVECPPA